MKKNKKQPASTQWYCPRKKKKRTNHCELDDGVTLRLCRIKNAKVSIKFKGMPTEEKCTNIKKAQNLINFKRHT